MNWTMYAEKLSGSIAKLGGKRVAVLAFVGILVFLTVGVSSVYLTRPQYEPLYSGLDPQDVNNIGIALNEARIPFDVSEDGKVVKVQFGQTSRARMLLAEKGLPRSAKAGYELFDNMGSLGLTSFMQEVTLVRALEGEIARTIQLLRGVKAARVHIVMPKTGSFRQRNRTPTASVIVRTDSGYSFSSAEAVRHVVAAAIPGLNIDAVTVLNTDGSLLASGKDRNSAMPRQLINLEMAAGKQIKENIQSTLTPYLGMKNFQLSVAVRLDTDKRNSTETTYDPGSRVERSIREIKEKGTAENANTSSSTTVKQDIPEQETSPGPSQKNSENKERKEKLINYEVSSKTVSTIGAGYSIKNMSIAAVVNREAIQNRDGKQFSDKELEAQKQEIEQLIGTAAGFNSKRGDKLKVTVVKFRSISEPLESAPPIEVLGYLFRILPNFLNGLVFLGVTALVVFYGFRPATRALLEIGNQPEKAEPTISSDTPLSLEGKKEQPQISTQPTPAMLGRSDTSKDQNLIDDVIGNVSDMPMKRLEQMIEFDEDQAASVLKNWVHEENLS